MSKIEWTSETWNPIAGCSATSPGCTNCFAVLMAARLERMSLALKAQGKNPGRLEYYEGLTKDGQWTGEVRFIMEALELPLKWKKPTLVFVNSMSDLFHLQVNKEWVDAIFAVMEETPHHVYQILTKRPERAFELLKDRPPLKNVWIGVSICTINETKLYARYLEKIKGRGWQTFASFEPWLSKGFSEIFEIANYLDWAIIGGESGSNVRNFYAKAAIEAAEVFGQANVPLFVKQLGRYPVGIDGHLLWAGGGKGGDRAKWPAELQALPQQLPLAMSKLLQS